MTPRVSPPSKLFYCGIGMKAGVLGNQWDAATAPIVTCNETADCIPVDVAPEGALSL